MAVGCIIKINKKKMKQEYLKLKLGDLIQHCTEVNFKKGYDPIGDIINEFEYNCELDPISQEIVDKHYQEWWDDIQIYEMQKEHIRWEYRCRLREQMAPGFYETYFLPFFNTTLKEVYENDQTEELKFYKPPFEEWVFMILAVMTEYYFREEYPFSYDRLNWFNLDLHRGRFKTDIFRRYNAVTW